MRETKRITIAEVEYIAYKLAKETMKWNEPIPDFSSRYPNILESCLATPFQSFGGQKAYTGLIARAAILFYLMIKNHPFQNGNKRIAMTTLFIFLFMNKKWLKIDNQKLYNFSVGVAQSLPELRKETVLGIEKFIKLYIVDLNKLHV